MTSTDTIAAAAAHTIPLPIRILRRLEPLIAALLRSPLHGLLSREVLLLAYTGRKSGRRYVLPLSYVRLGDALVLCTRPEGSRWWRNLRGGQDVELTLEGRIVKATARVLDPSSSDALDGLREFVTRNPRTGVMLYRVAQTPAGAPDENDLRREVAASIVVRLEVLPRQEAVAAG